MPDMPLPPSEEGDDDGGPTVWGRALAVQSQRMQNPESMRPEIEPTYIERDIGGCRWTLIIMLLCAAFSMWVIAKMLGI